MTRVTLVAWLVAVALCFAGASRAQAMIVEVKPGTPTPAQLDALVAQLGSEDFQKREEAQAALVKAGAAAVPALAKAKDHADMQVRTTAARILQEVQWASLGTNQNYLALFPAESIFALRLTNLKQSLARSKETALGKLLTGPQFKPLVDLLDARARAAEPQGVATFEKWAARFQGQMGGAVWAFSPFDPLGIRAALIVELTSDAPAQVFQELLNETKVGAMLMPVRSEGLTIRVSQMGVGAVTLAGRHIILGANQASVEEVARALVKPAANSLLDSPMYQKMKPALGDGWEFGFVMNFQSYLKMLKAMPGMDQMGKMMDDMGYGSMEAMAMMTHVAGDRFEDRFVMLTNNKPAPLMDMMKLWMTSATPPREALAVAPANAVAAGAGYLDGKAVFDFGVNYIKGMMKAMPNAGGAPDVDAVLAQAEAVLGLKVPDLVANVKGDFTWWVVLADQLAAPEIGCSIGCADAAAAQRLAEALPKMLDVVARDGKPADQRQVPPSAALVERNGRKLWTEAENSALLQERERKIVPYRLTWATHGQRLLLGTSVDAVTARMAALDAKTPGLDPARMLPGNVDAGKIPGFMGLDVAQLLEFGRQHGFPLLAKELAQTGQNGVFAKKAFAVLCDLAATKGLFKDVPALAIVSDGVKDGVLVTRMYSPTPYLPTVFTGAVGAGVFMSRMVRAGAAAGAGQPPPPPPAKDDF